MQSGNVNFWRNHGLCMGRMRRHGSFRHGGIHRDTVSRFLQITIGATTNANGFVMRNWNMERKGLGIVEMESAGEKWELGLNVQIDGSID